ncbi:MAG: hypothetical protein ACI849_001081 [Patiriisocius sp.]|jgi:hypothetical protein
MIHTICYSSKAVDNLQEEGLESIYNKTYTNNSIRNVTGILLFELGNFFQVLEGEKDIIMPLYEEKIKKDPRHHSIFEIINKPKQKALFLDYRTDFNIIRTPEQLAMIDTYLKEHKVSTSEKIQRLLQPFLLLP